MEICWQMSWYWEMLSGARIYSSLMTLVRWSPRQLEGWMHFWQSNWSAKPAWCRMCGRPITAYSFWWSFARKSPSRKEEYVENRVLWVAEVIVFARRWIASYGLKGWSRSIYPMLGYVLFLERGPCICWPFASVKSPFMTSGLTSYDFIKGAKRC